MYLLGTASILPEVPCSLLSAIRVDSYYSSVQQPKYQVLLDAESVQLSFYNHLHHLQHTHLSTSQHFNGLKLEQNFPVDQNFMSASLDAVSFELSVWQGNKLTPGMY